MENYNHIELHENQEVSLELSLSSLNKLHEIHHQEHTNQAPYQPAIPALQINQDPEPAIEAGLPLVIVLDEERDNHDELDEHQKPVLHDKGLGIIVAGVENNAGEGNNVQAENQQPVLHEKGLQVLDTGAENNAGVGNILDAGNQEPVLNDEGLQIIEAGAENNADVGNVLGMPAHHAPLLLPVLVPSLTTLEQLAEQGITLQRGLLICNKCSQFKVVDLDIQHTFEGLFQFFLQLGNRINFFSLQDGSGDLKPEPLHMACDECLCSGSMRAVIGDDDVNEFNSWLFLLLGRFMGSVDGAHLIRLFPDNQYIGSRTKLLFDVCIGLLSQLDPVGSQQLLFLYQPMP